ncbi:MAG: GldG family protein [Candidatus Aureabacteria bacterium]|nr:GldG family protein [Candidatus Auribacterota bacterium]
MSREGIPRIHRAAIGMNVATVCVVAAAIVVMANYLSYRHYKRIDWTKSSYYTLSDKTVNVLKELKVPVKVYVFYQPFHKVAGDIRELLNRYAGVTKNFEVEHVDPDKDPVRVRFLLNKFKIPASSQANLVVFEQGDRNKYVYDKDIIEMDYSGMRSRQAPTVKAFKGEQAFTSAILNLTQAKQPIAYLVTGHGEKEIEDTRQGGLQVCSTLLERENIKVQKLAIYEKKEIPQDCDLLLVIGPREPFMDEEKKAIGRYLERGGRVLIALDPQTHSGLETPLRNWDVEVGNDMVVDPESAQRMLFFSALNLFASNYGAHEITNDMKGRATLFAEVRSVKPGTENASLKATALVQTSAEGWGETSMNDEQFRFDEGKDLKGPVTFGVAVEAAPGKAGEKPLKNMRLVVIGDADFVANAQVTNLSNASFFLNIVNWLTSREKLIAIGPKMPEQTRVRLNAAQMSSIFWSTLLGMPALGLILGVVVWWRRRK